VPRKQGQPGKRRQSTDEPRPGMKVQATGGDLGESDISKPKVSEVVEGSNGNAEKLVVKKGVVFKKTLEIPADRVQSVKTTTRGDKQGKVTVDVSAAETRALKATGEEELLSEDELDLLDLAQRKVPTTEGMRELEALNKIAPGSSRDDPRAEQLEKEASRAPKSKLKLVLSIVGPGFLSGMAGNDSSAVGAYSIDGASNGYGHLWLMLLSTPLYQAVQFACAKIGRVTQRGMAEILRVHYGRRVAVLASLVLIVANVALVAADLVAIGSGFELITGLSYFWFIVPVAAALWYLTVYRNFETIKKIFIALSLAFVAYIITAIFSGANWGTVLVRTFVPQIGFDFTSISSAVALLGATISPYSMFWQAKAEIEEKREGTLKQQTRTIMIDVGSGAIAGQVVAYFIIICTASTLFVHHQNITTAADAARSLEPLVGPLARYLFAIGLIGSGLVAIPVLLASTSYAITGAMGWPGALAKRPWQSEGFYLVLTVAAIAGLVITLFGVNPIQLIFWSNVIAAIIAPLLVIAILLVGNHRRIMKGQRLSLLNNLGLVLIVLILIAGAILLFYQLATGHRS